MNSIFTRIINREIPATIVFENEKIIAIKDINPAAPVHILVIPKKEIPTLNDITLEDKELLGEVFLAIADIAKDLKIADNGYRVIANCNHHGGQEVFHIHFHILAGEPIGALRT
ncbi:MAG: histidine triad nucleotide-binding protein [Fusobacteriaceae bacterium]